MPKVSLEGKFSSLVMDKYLLLLVSDRYLLTGKDTLNEIVLSDTAMELMHLVDSAATRKGYSPEQLDQLLLDTAYAIASVQKALRIAFSEMTFSEM